ncbi:hypothetical protein NEOC65_001801 [Neochlamydia sp. AcF65]|nr:hypothetical protein [Neochlamydia sp. AcF65]MBS4171501.1 hypothetical protein [Neochlamydia sp. AcF95]
MPIRKIRKKSREGLAIKYFQTSLGLRDILKVSELF